MAGLQTSRAIKWLIDNDYALKDRIAGYLYGHNNWHDIPYIMPAPAEEMAKHRANRDKYKLMVPQITLYLKRTKHHLTGEIGVEVSCSDDDERVIMRTYYETNERSLIARMKTLN